MKTRLLFATFFVLTLTASAYITDHPKRNVLADNPPCCGGDPGGSVEKAKSPLPTPPPKP